jgi:hypothetical protein
MQIKIALLAHHLSNEAEINNIEKIRGNLKEGKKKLNVSSKKGSNGIIITSNGVK